MCYNRSHVTVFLKTRPIEIGPFKIYTEIPSSTMFAVLVTRCILVACLIQSNYAEVCYLRSHRGYGGCIRWFLQAHEDSRCTSIKFGGYAATFYKHTQIMELDQPFISDKAEEVQSFLKNRTVTVLQSDIFDSAPSTQSSCQLSTVQQSPLTTVTETTQDGDFDYSASSPQSPQQPSTNGQVLTTPREISDINCSSNMSKGILNCTGSKVIKCEDDIGHCSKNIDGTVLICGCNSTDTSNFIPMGFTHVNGTRRCYCNEQGTTECIKNDHMNDSSMCNSEVEIANWTCQIDNDGYQTNLRKLPRDCHDLYENGVRDNGIYCVYPDYLRNSSEPHRTVYCYMGTEGETESWTCQIGNHGYQNGLSKEPRSKPSDCHDLYGEGVRANGIHCVYPDYLINSSKPHLQVYCNMTAWPQGGWTVIQRRVNGSVDFNRSWNDYKDGFGKINHEFWLGNENIYHLTNRNDMELRIDITNESGNFFATYLFGIGNETTGYKLLQLEDCRQKKDECAVFQARVNTPFLTHDRDMTMNGTTNCTNISHGGWWFTDCHTCNLNGVYGESSVNGTPILEGCEYNISRTEMKIRPVHN